MTPQNVIEAFYQKGENDCTTLEFIKVAISKFGIDTRIFKHSKIIIHL